jgi:hypothetical protein
VSCLPGPGTIHRAPGGRWHGQAAFMASIAKTLKSSCIELSLNFGDGLAGQAAAVVG